MSNKKGTPRLARCFRTCYYDSILGEGIIGEFKGILVEIRKWVPLSNSDSIVLWSRVQDYTRISLWLDFKKYLRLDIWPRKKFQGWIWNKTLVVYFLLLPLKRIILGVRDEKGTCYAIIWRNYFILHIPYSIPNHVFYFSICLVLKQNVWLPFTESLGRHQIYVNM